MKVIVWLSLCLFLVSCDQESAISPTEVTREVSLTTVSPTTGVLPTSPATHTVLSTPVSLQAISNKNVLGIKLIKNWHVDDYLLAAKWSPDGKTLAIGGSNIFIYDAATFKRKRTILANDWVGAQLAFSFDGQTLAAGNEYIDNFILRLWDVNSGKRKEILEGHSASVQAVAFAPERLLLASGGADTSIRLWDVSTGEIIREINLLEGTVWGLAFSPDGKVLASASGDGVALWNPNTGQLQNMYKGQAEAVAFSRDGSLLAAGNDSAEVRLWNLKENRLLFTLIEYATTEIWGLDFSSDGTVLISGRDSAQFWDTKTGVLLRTIEEASGRFAISPDGKMLVSVCADGNVRLWGVDGAFTTPTPSPHLFSIGGVFVITNKGAGLNLREASHRESSIVRTLVEGEQITVIDGPIDDEDFTWWKIQTNLDKRTGWVVYIEDWYDPIKQVSCKGESG
ncbi:MAG: SH3 domain-containing protein [Anaerolineales bacterium]|nr:SH3 domain-containing protein [Anaerolineales bacterium]